MNGYTFCAASSIQVPTQCMPICTWAPKCLSKSPCDHKVHFLGWVGNAVLLLCVSAGWNWTGHLAELQNLPRSRGIRLRIRLIASGHSRLCDVVANCYDTHGSLRLLVTCQRCVSNLWHSSLSATTGCVEEARLSCQMSHNAAAAEQVLQLNAMTSGYESRYYAAGCQGQICVRSHTVRELAI